MAAFGAKSGNELAAITKQFQETATKQTQIESSLTDMMRTLTDVVARTEVEQVGLRREVENLKMGLMGTMRTLP
jgi:hypothetical protein